MDDPLICADCGKPILGVDPKVYGIPEDELWICDDCAEAEEAELAEQNERGV